MDTGEFNAGVNLRQMEFFIIYVPWVLGLVQLNHFQYGGRVWFEAGFFDVFFNSSAKLKWKIHHHNIHYLITDSKYFFPFSTDSLHLDVSFSLTVARRTKKTTIDLFNWFGTGQIPLCHYFRLKGVFTLSCILHRWNASPFICHFYRLIKENSAMRFLEFFRQKKKA